MGQMDTPSSRCTQSRQSVGSEADAGSCKDARLLRISLWIDELGRLLLAHSISNCLFRSISDDCRLQLSVRMLWPSG